MKTLSFDSHIKTRIEGVKKVIKTVADESRRAYGRQLIKDGEFILAAHERLKRDDYQGDDIQRELDANCSGDKDCLQYMDETLDYIRKSYRG